MGGQIAAYLLLCLPCPGVFIHLFFPCSIFFRSHPHHTFTLYRISHPRKTNNRFRLKKQTKFNPALPTAKSHGRSDCCVHYLLLCLPCPSVFFFFFFFSLLHFFHAVPYFTPSENKQQVPAEAHLRRVPPSILRSEGVRGGETLFRGMPSRRIMHLRQVLGSVRMSRRSHERARLKLR